MKLIEFLSKEDMLLMLRGKLTKDGYEVSTRNAPWIEVTGEDHSARIFIQDEDKGTWALNWYSLKKNGKLMDTKFELPLEKVLRLIKSLKPKP